MIDRRKFIKTVSALGISLPFVKSNIKAASNPNIKNNPIILCSRGEKWGKKVLKPGWDILKKNGLLLDAIEKSANVTELDPKDTSVGYGGLPNEDDLSGTAPDLSHDSGAGEGGVRAFGQSASKHLHRFPKTSATESADASARGSLPRGPTHRC